MKTTAVFLILLLPLSGCTAWKVRAEAYDRATDVQDSAVENLRATAVTYLFRLTREKLKSAAMEDDPGALLKRLSTDGRVKYANTTPDEIRAALTVEIIDGCKEALLDTQSAEDKAAGAPDRPGIEDWYVDYVRAGGLLDDTALRAILRDRGWFSNIEAVMQEYGYGMGVTLPPRPVASPPPSEPEEESADDGPAARANNRKPLKAKVARADTWHGKPLFPNKTEIGFR